MSLPPKPIICEKYPYYRVKSCERFVLKLSLSLQIKKLGYLEVVVKIYIKQSFVFAYLQLPCLF